MSKSHNKKRNVGIIYEQMLRGISQSLVNNDNDKAATITSILKKHFIPGSELYKEFRLFNALVKTSINSEGLALRILDEAKNAAIDHDAPKLRREKAALIKEINYKINDSKFYSQRVNDYRSYATIQTLLNDWRKPKSHNLSRINSYEQKVCTWLLKEKIEDDANIKKTEEVDKLTVSIMTEKFNKKYLGTLNNIQVDLIREYVFSITSGDTSGFKKYLDDIKSSTLNELYNFKDTCNNDILNNKIDVIKKNIVELDTSIIDDESISKFLLVSGLRLELLENENV